MRIRTLAIATLMLAACSGSSNSQKDADYAEAMAKEHAADTTKPSGAEAQAAGAFETTSAMVEYGTVDGRVLNGYLATPQGEKPTAAVIVVHEWWGLNDNIKAMTDKLASLGYAALAVDMYGKPPATTPEDAKKLMMASMEKPENGVANLEAAHTFLVGQGATKFGVIGWCFGGGWSLQAGLTQGAGINAVVMYYGHVKTKPEEVASLTAPLIGFFGAEDEGIPVAQVREFEAALKAAGKTADINVYDGANHAFANPTGDRYIKEAADDAWSKTVAFFAANL